MAGASAGADAQKHQALKVHMLSDIAYALCDRLDADNTEWLYKTVRPQVNATPPGDGV